MNTNLFKAAAKEGYRFQFKGNISVEDLFNLSTTELNTIYKTLNSELGENVEDLLGGESSVDKELKNKMKIVKEIFNDKVKEQKEKEKALIEKQRKERIKEIIAQKKDDDLSSKSIEELEAMLG